MRDHIRRTTLEANIASARNNLNDHAADCALWDYESNNGCEVCDRLERRLAELRAIRARLAEVES